MLFRDNTTQGRKTTRTRTHHHPTTIGIGTHSHRHDRGHSSNTRVTYFTGCQTYKPPGWVTVTSAATSWRTVAAERCPALGSLLGSRGLHEGSHRLRMCWCKRCTYGQQSQHITTSQTTATMGQTLQGREVEQGVPQRVQRLLRRLRAVLRARLTLFSVRVVGLCLWLRRGRRPADLGRPNQTRSGFRRLGGGVLQDGVDVEEGLKEPSP